jgi:hypothetical protein
MNDKHEEFDAKKHFAILKATLENRDEAVREMEKDRIIGLLEKLKIDDAFLERWNDKTSDGEDVLYNTIEMIIREIKKVKQ